MKVLDLSYHPLDVRSGGWVDLSRKGNHGTPYGGARPFQIAPGVMGFEFDGGYVDCGNSPSLNTTNAITVAVWVKPTILNFWYHIIGKKSDYGVNHPAFWVRIVKDSNKFEFCSYGHPTVTSITESEINKWFYVVGTIGPLRKKIYINSVCEQDCGKSSGIISTVYPVEIGRKPGTSAEFFYGLIAQPIIEDRAWSPDEVRENMYRSPIYRMLRGLPHSMIYTKVPWKQTQGGIYVM